MNINAIETDTKMKIFSYLDYPTMAKSAQVCKLWYKETRNHLNWTNLVSDTFASAVQTQPSQNLELKKFEIVSLAFSKTHTEDTPELRQRIVTFIKNFRGNEGTFFVLFPNTSKYSLKINVQIENRDGRFNFHKKIVDACMFSTSPINRITDIFYDVNSIIDTEITQHVIQNSPLICIESNIPNLLPETILTTKMIKRINHLSLSFVQYHSRKIVSFANDQFSTLFATSYSLVQYGIISHDLDEYLRSIISLVAIPTAATTLTLHATTGSPSLIRSPGANRFAVITTILYLALAAFNYYRHEF